MDTLRNALKAARVVSKKQLLLWIDSKSIANGYSVLTAKDLKLDSEKRCYDKVVEYKKVIFKCDSILFANSTTLSFTDCIFTGEIQINKKFDEPFDKLYFDNCIADKIHFGGIESKIDITISSVNTKSLLVSNSQLGKLCVSSSNIELFWVNDSKISEMGMYFNRLYRLRIFGSILPEKFKFDNSQIVNISKMLKNKPNKSFSLLRFVEMSHITKIMDKNDHFAKISTVEYILSNSNISCNRESFSHAKYIYAVLTQSNWLFSLGQIIVGGFIKPFRIAILSFFTIIAFACFYYSKFSLFEINANEFRNLFFWEAIYYSGATFITLGDSVTPIGLSKIATIIEALAGIVLSSSFLVSLTRKYVE